MIQGWKRQRTDKYLTDQNSFSGHHSSEKFRIILFESL